MEWFDWDQRFAGHRVINLGISGETIEMLLDRLSLVKQKHPDADLIFIEANHDLELLRQYYNPNSHYHLPNPTAAKMLEEVCDRSTAPPANVILGHISPQRNTREIAIEEVTAHFNRSKKQMDFDLSAAPLNTAGDPVVI